MPTASDVRRARFIDASVADYRGKGNLMTTEFALLFAIGFVAQLVDGTLGMAYGVLTNAALLTMGLPPAHASALVHTAEVFTTGASAASHIYHRNVDWRMVARLGVTGVLGAILGAWILSNIDIGAARRLVYGYLLLMGLYILWQSARIALTPRTPAGWLAPLGLIAGFLDASGGGGWGPVTTSTLIGSGHAPRQTVGSVNTTEFFVTVAAAVTFFAELGASPLQHLVPLVLGGVLAAPFGGWAVKHVPARALMIAVGVLIVTLSVFQLLRAFGVI
ncbi:MAG TPA: sulfite exporter TauE/SafE family protein [Pseudolabrys sp.]|nr:sulfite exporter TauE/SafE family protein [Pseudolabrys sp.]